MLGTLIGDARKHDTRSTSRFQLRQTSVNIYCTTCIKSGDIIVGLALLSLHRLGVLLQVERVVDVIRIV